MKLYLKDNLRLLRERKGYTQQGMAEKIELKKNTYANYETGYSTPDFLILKKLSNEFGFSVDDLLYKPLRDEAQFDGHSGTGKDHSAQLLTSQSNQQTSQTPNVYDVDGKEGSMNILLNIEKEIRNLPTLYLPKIGPGLHVRLQISGDSMHSTIKDNDYVIATFSPGSLDERVREGSVYVLVDDEDGIICKRVYRKNATTLELVSDNDTYKPYLRDNKHILAMYRIIQVQSSNLRNYNIDREISSLWQQLKQLNTRTDLQDGR